jgi:hypothetical protein
VVLKGRFRWFCHGFLPQQSQKLQHPV